MRRAIKMLLVAMLLLAALGVALAVWRKPMPDHPFFQRRAGVDVIAHRGGWRLWPENTLYAFQRAVDLGVDVLEMDLRRTKDGHLVVFHDETVSRTTQGDGRVADFALAELKRLDAGHQWSPDGGATFPFRGKGIVVPTLDEVFAAFPHMRMTIEIKQTEPDVVAAFGDAIRRHGMRDRVLVACFDSGTLKRFRKRFPEVATSAGMTEGMFFYALCYLHLGAVYHPPVEALQFPLKLGPIDGVHPRLLSGARKNNIQVQIWTVDDEAEMHMLIESGVAGIITRRPDRLLKILGRKATADDRG